jgi:hypothetical protein
MKRSPSSCPHRISAFALLAVLGAAPLHAASLSGTVTFRTAGVPSAIVSAYQVNTGRKIVTLTNNSGVYRFDNVASGSYVVIIEKDGRRVYQGRVNVGEPSARLDVQF